MSRRTAAVSLLIIALLGSTGVPRPRLSGQPLTQTVGPAELQRAIQRYLAERWAGRISRVVVRVSSPRESLHLPAGRLSIRVAPIAVVVRPGPSRFRAALFVNGVLAGKLTVAVVIEAYARLVLTRRTIERGEVLSVVDLTLNEWRVREIEHGLVLRPEEAIGKRTQVRLSAQRPIPRVALESLQ